MVDRVVLWLGDEPPWGTCCNCGASIPGFSWCSIDCAKQYGGYRMRR